jgi:O-acetylhomoserine (thiol)-lyase
VSTSREFGFETRMLHAGHVPDPYVGARAVPIYQTTSYVFQDADEAAHLFELKQYGNIYSRISNPTTAVLEERVASLEGGTGAVAVASGMAAQFGVVMTLCSPGDHIVASSQLYGGSLTQFAHTLKKLSVDCDFVSPTHGSSPGGRGGIDDWAAAITPKTRMLFVETIGNPSGSVADLGALAELADSHSIPLVVDNTFATPYLCRPIEHGATIVIHSATKFIGGHGTSIGGIVVDSGDFDFSGFPTIAEASPSYHGMKFYDTFGHYGFLMKLRAETVRDTGACISPFNSFLLIQGLETLSLRMERHVNNALGVAEFLLGNKAVERVHYAGLHSHPHHGLARQYLPKGAGAVMAFEIKGGREAGKRFIESLQLFSHLANVGDAKSLVIHPASTTHQQNSDEELARGGITPGTVRLSVGLETLDDLLWDLDHALERASI